MTFRSLFDSSFPASAPCIGGFSFNNFSNTSKYAFNQLAYSLVCAISMLARTSLANSSCFAVVTFEAKNFSACSAKFFGTMMIVDC